MVTRVGPDSVTGVLIQRGNLGADRPAGKEAGETHRGRQPATGGRPLQARTAGDHRKPQQTAEAGDSLLEPPEEHGPADTLTLNF